MEKDQYAQVFHQGLKQQKRDGQFLSQYTLQQRANFTMSQLSFKMLLDSTKLLVIVPLNVPSKAPIL